MRLGVKLKGWDYLKFIKHGKRSLQAYTVLDLQIFQYPNVQDRKWTQNTVMLIKTKQLGKNL